MSLAVLYQGCYNVFSDVPRDLGSLNSANSPARCAKEGLADDPAQVYAAPYGVTQCKCATSFTGTTVYSEDW